MVALAHVFYCPCCHTRLRFVNDSLEGASGRWVCPRGQDRAHPSCRNGKRLTTGNAATKALTALPKPVWAFG